MSATIIDGKAEARRIRERLREKARAFQRQVGRRPGLHVILVGEDPASEVYVRNKARAAEEAGYASWVERLPAETTEEALLQRIEALNLDPRIDGILVQLPLPGHIAEERIIEAIDPAKDVDGFHPVNAGRLLTGGDGLVPCTPLGCLHLIRTVRPDLAGARALVIGRSNIVGKPMALLLLAAHATVTVAHSRTRDLPALAREAEV
ncbi:MAG: bifunctional methylenetetrahydrofolate dehydrogenase/methenyltetrahydrofolate cyclohydrolase, partial [Alphaproteobacteria bacterium]